MKLILLFWLLWTVSAEHIRMEENNEVRVLQTTDPTTTLTSLISYLSNVINLLKRVMVLGAMLFLIEDLINFWVLASSYAFLNIGVPTALSDTLSSIYDEYNKSYLQYLGISINYPSVDSTTTLLCGIETNFNVLSFALEPVAMLILIMIELSLIAWAIRWLKKEFRQQQIDILRSMVDGEISRVNAKVINVDTSVGQAPKGEDVGGAIVRGMVGQKAGRHWSQNIHVNRMEQAAAVIINYMSGLLVPAYGMIFEYKIVNLSMMGNFLGFHLLLSLTLLFPIAYFTVILSRKDTLKRSQIETFFQYCLNLSMSLALGYNCSIIPFLSVTTIVLTAYLIYTLMSYRQISLRTMSLAQASNIVKKLTFWLYNLLFVVMAVLSKYQMESHMEYLGIACLGVFFFGGSHELLEFGMRALVMICRVLYMLFKILWSGDYSVEPESQVGSQQGNQNNKITPKNKANPEQRQREEERSDEYECRREIKRSLSLLAKVIEEQNEISKAIDRVAVLNCQPHRQPHRQPHPNRKVS